MILEGLKWGFALEAVQKQDRVGDSIIGDLNQYYLEEGKTGVTTPLDCV